jgi:hypothetical protein
MTWKNYTCEILGKPALVLIDQRFHEQLPVKELPRLSWFGVHCKQAPSGSFWHPNETQALDEIEADLLKACEAFGNGWIVYVPCITTPGIREYYLYHSDAADLNKAMEALKATHPTYRIEKDTIADPEWNEYRKYASFERS